MPAIARRRRGGPVGGRDTCSPAGAPHDPAPSIRPGSHEHGREPYRNGSRRVTQPLFSTAHSQFQPGLRGFLSPPLCNWEQPVGRLGPTVPVPASTDDDPARCGFITRRQRAGLDRDGFTGEHTSGHGWRPRRIGDVSVLPSCGRHDDDCSDQRWCRLALYAMRSAMGPRPSGRRCRLCALALHARSLVNTLNRLPHTLGPDR